jgi:hypothetical protein
VRVRGALICYDRYVAYAAEWDLDDAVLDREEVEAVVAHVAALAHVAAEVTCGRQGLYCTFRFPVAAAAEVVAALDPSGELLGDDWYRDLDPPSSDDPEDGYTVRVELLGPVAGGLVDDDLTAWERPAGGDAEPPDADDEPDDVDAEVLDVSDDDDDDDDGACLARLRAESLDNREAWPVAFAIAAAIVDRLGGDLRDEIDDELFELQRQVPKVVVNGETSAPVPVPSRDEQADDEWLN